MATIYRCDRCKQDFAWPLRGLYTRMEESWYGDLCKDCLEALSKWIMENNGKK